MSTRNPKVNNLSCNICTRKQIEPIKKPMFGYYNSWSLTYGGYKQVQRQIAHFIAFLPSALHWSADS